VHTQTQPAHTLRALTHTHTHTHTHIRTHTQMHTHTNAHTHTYTHIHTHTLHAPATFVNTAKPVQQVDAGNAHVRETNGTVVDPV